MKKAKIYGLLVLAGLLLSACSNIQETSDSAVSTPISSPTEASNQMDYWPDDVWRTSSPEEQGVDSKTIVDLLDYIDDNALNIHSVLIIRNGNLITEAYFYPHNQESSINIYSCTKGVVSALVGLALDHAYLEDINQPVLVYFSDREIANLDEQKQNITIEHLLTMSSGLEWDEWGSTTINGQFYSSLDWIQFELDRPMKDEPGTRFVYNTGGPHLLTGILQSEIGMTALAFGKTQLFEPLGISDVLWQSDAYFVNDGGSGVHMTPRDMAKFGYLYLKDGIWNAEQIIPSNWVQTSTQAHIDAEMGKQYGYLWWVDPDGRYYWCRGWNGQRIFVIPSERMIVVMTANAPGTDMLLMPEGLLENFILPAVISDEALPENSEAFRKLQDRISEHSEP